MKISSLTGRAHIAGFLLICPSLAFATTIDWTLDATTLLIPADSGLQPASVTGTFTYDNILHEYSNVNLKYTGDLLIDFTATTVWDGTSLDVFVLGPEMGDHNIKPSFLLHFASSLDLASAGDTIAVCGGVGTINDLRPGCGDRHSNVSGITDLASLEDQLEYFIGTGTITSESAPAVPIPATVWLFGSGLLGLIGVARRKKV